MVSEENTSLPTALIIDDEADIGEILETLIDEYFECTVITSGKDGLNQIKNNKFDLVITDLNMPDISGIDIIKATKIHQKSAKIFVSTGHGADDPEVKKALEAGADGFLAKPFCSPDKLFKIINGKMSG